MKQLESTELFEAFVEHLKCNVYHKHYQRTIDLAKFYASLKSGDGQDDYLITATTKSSIKQKEQKIRVTHSRTQYVCALVDHSLCELDKQDKVVQKIHSKDNEDGIADIEERLKVFYASKPLYNYAFQRIKDLNQVDPNAYIVVEQSDINDEKETYSYPVEIYSNQVWQYKKNNGNLQYIISKKKTEFQTCKDTLQDQFVHPQKYYEEPDLEKRQQSDRFKIERDGYNTYTMYAPNCIFRFIEKPESDKGQIVIPEDYTQITIDVQHKPTTFFYKKFETKLDINPAFSVGYIPDDETNGETNVGIYHVAEKLFLQHIEDNAQLSLTKAIHGFIQKFVYGKTCTNSEKLEGGQKSVCERGKMSITGNTCGKCQNGVLTHLSVSDVIIVREPKSKDDVAVPLSERIHYESIPPHIIKCLEENLRRLESDIPRAILRIKDAAAEKNTYVNTATEASMVKYESYAVLNQLGKQISCFIEHAIKVQAKYLSINDIEASHMFPMDLKLENVNELLTQRQLAVTSGAPHHILKAIDRNISEKLYASNTKYLDTQDAWEQFRPFNSKTEQERISLLSVLDDNHPQKLLYCYFESIKIEIEYELASIDFAALTYPRQKDLIDKKVSALIAADQAQRDARDPQRPGIDTVIDE